MLFYMGKDRMPEIAALYVGESTIESCFLLERVQKKAVFCWREYNRKLFFVGESTIENCFLLDRAQSKALFAGEATTESFG